MTMPTSTTIQQDASVLGDSASADVVCHLLDRLGELVPEVAGDKSKRKCIEDALRKEFGGQKVYIGSALSREEAIREICRRFNGRNASTLAREYGIPRPSVYRYLKQAGK